MIPDLAGLFLGSFVFKFFLVIELHVLNFELVISTVVLKMRSHFQLITYQSLFLDLFFIIAGELHKKKFRQVEIFFFLYTVTLGNGFAHRKELE